VTDAPIGFPETTSDERDLLLRWLRYLRGAVMRKAEGVSDADARWRPDNRLISLLGIVTHLANVEWRWVDGGILGEQVSRAEEEFQPGTERSIEGALAAYRERQIKTDAIVSAAPSLTEPCRGWDGEGKDLRWVLLHLINETARHAGHADAVRELIDGLTGE
jgi:uncharacterized damage-inducible protein DinB